MEIGDCFWLAEYPRYIKHLRTVIARDGDCVLTVSVSSMRKRADKSCVLTASDHPDLVRSSVVRYDSAREFSAKTLSSSVAAGRLTLRARVSAQVVQRIIDGARQTKSLAKKHKRKWFPTNP